MRGVGEGRDVPTADTASAARSAVGAGDSALALVDVLVGLGGEVLDLLPVRDQGEGKGGDVRP
jgi:hypothetical protein